MSCIVLSWLKRKKKIKLCIIAKVVEKLLNTRYRMLAATIKVKMMMQKPWIPYPVLVTLHHGIFWGKSLEIWGLKHVVAFFF